MSVKEPAELGATNSRRWWLCGLVGLATALSFLDRQVLSVLAKEVQDKLGMDDVAYSQVTNAFLVSYALMFLVGGRALDLIGTRLGMALSVGIWSVASALHSAVQNATQLGACRFLLGLGEGACIPGATKGVAEWFAPRERALAVGIAIGGVSVGMVLAPPLTVWLAKAVGWRGVFIISGVMGAVWVVGWGLLSGRRATPSAPSATAAPRGARPAEERLGTLVRRMDVWGFALVRFLVDPVFYFYMFWIPKYLSAERGLSQEAIGALTWIPFLALGLSNIAGGWASDQVLRSGRTAFQARRLIMAGAALLTMTSGLAACVPTVGLAIAMMSLLMLAHGFWVTNYITLISERYPQGAVATVTGFSGAVGAVGGMVANTAIGFVVTHFSYGPVWVASGGMYPLAFLVLLLTVRRQSFSTGGTP